MRKAPTSGGARTQTGQTHLGVESLRNLPTQLRECPQRVGVLFLASSPWRAERASLPPSLSSSPVRTTGTPSPASWRQQRNQTPVTTVWSWWRTAYNCSAVSTSLWQSSQYAGPSVQASLTSSLACWAVLEPSDWGTACRPVPEVSGWPPLS